MAAPTIQIKRGQFANLPGLKVGEPGFTTDKYDLYVGLDGTTNNNKFFGSHRYWNKETESTGSSVRLVEGSTSGSNFIALKSPDTLSADTTYTFPATPSAGYLLQTDGSGVLSWVPAASDNAITRLTIFDETTQVGGANSISNIYIKGEGITASAVGTSATFTVNAASSTVAGVSSYNSSDFYFTNTYQVGVTTATSSTKGIASFNSTDFYISGGSVGINTVSIQNMVGIASTATRATKVDTTTSTATGYIPFVANGTTTAGESLLVDTGIVYNASTTRLGIGTTSPRATLHVKNDLLVSTGTTASYDIAIKATTSDSGTLSFEDPDSTKQYFSINKDTSTLFAINKSDYEPAFIVNSVGNLGIGTTSPTSNLHVVGNAYITGIVTATTFVGNVTGTASTATKINTTTSTASGYIPFVANSTTTTGESLLVDSGIQYNGSTDTLIVANAQHSTVKAEDGTAAITITSGTGAVGISSNLTVQGNLYVNGTTTQVNTGSLTVEDRTIDLGIVDGAAPASATTWDLGILFNYFDTSAKKSGVIWENANSRFQFANSLTSETAGSDANSPQIVTASFAPIEIGALWMNDTAGQSAVASYLAADGLFTGSTAGRYLQNITVDAGVF